MRVYDTPGVYYERGDASAGGIAALRTDVAGFVGIAGRGPVGVAMPVESARQFEAWFGPPIDQGYLAYSARAFFENGGRRLWCARAASPAAATASIVVEDAPGHAAWRIEAASPGVWGNAVAIRMSERRRMQARGVTDTADARIVHLPVVAGFDRLALVEVSAGAAIGRALVIAIDAAAGTVTLDRAIAAIGVAESVVVETIACALDVFESGMLVAQYVDLTLQPAHARYGPRLLAQPWLGVDVDHPERPERRASDAALAADYFRTGGNRGSVAPPVVVITELRSAVERDALLPLREVRSAGGTATPLATDAPSAVLLEGGADGLIALSVGDFSDALALLEPVDEISLLSVPDIHIQPRPVNPVVPPPPCAPGGCLPSDAPPAIPTLVPIGETPPRFSLDAVYAVQAAMVAQCERRRDRVALLDAPFETCGRLTFAASELRAWRARFDTAFAALYAPWLFVVDPLRRGGAGQAVTRAIPPCGHVAGSCAALDLRSGAHLAPANVPLSWVQDVSLAVDDTLHGVLNTLGINAVRAQPGRGVRVLGARTVSSDPDWRFLNVRRLMSMIEKSIDVAIQWAVFEPNDWRTRAKLTLAIQSLLVGLWQRGAMVGAVAGEAFFVRCDDTNNPPELRANGRLLIEAGVAPSVPFEFVVMRIGRDANGFTISSSGEPSPAAS